MNFRYTLINWYLIIAFFYNFIYIIQKKLIIFDLHKNRLNRDKLELFIFSLRIICNKYDCSRVPKWMY